MRKNFRLSITTSAAVAMLAAGSAVYVHAADAHKSQHQGGMMHSQGDMMGMMNMMQQMNQMMERCNAMMKDHQQRAPDTPKGEQKPAPKS
jgi:hypothetical protein